MIFTYFKVNGQNAQQLDATQNVTTDAYQFNNSHGWMVSINDINVAGGPGTWTIQVSNNSSKWYDLNLDSTDVVLEDAVDSDFIGFKYMRVVYSSNGTTAGTIDIELTLQNNTRSSNL